MNCIANSVPPHYRRTPHHDQTRISHHLFNEYGLILLQGTRKVDWHLEHIGNNVSRCQRKPLGQGDIRNSVRLVDLDPDQVLVADVLNIVARVVGEDSSVARLEVDGPGIAVAGEDGGLGLASVEVQPLLSLLLVSHVLFQKGTRLRTLGCQWSSRRAPGLSVTKVAAIVLLMGKLVESIL